MSGMYFVDFFVLSYRLRLMEAEREKRLLQRERRLAGLPEDPYPYLGFVPRKINRYIMQIIGREGM